MNAYPEPVAADIAKTLRATHQTAVGPAVLRAEDAEDYDDNVVWWYVMDYVQTANGEWWDACELLTQPIINKVCDEEKAREEGRALEDRAERLGRARNERMGVV